MQSKTLLKKLLSMFVFVGAGLSLAFFLNSIKQNYDLPSGMPAGWASSVVQGSSALLVENAVISPIQEQTILPETVGKPVRLKIPKINVDVAVEYVGLTSGGAVDIPKKQGDAAWFNLGPRPGENGSAIITGHYGRKNNKSSAFDNLYKLRKGDKLYVEDDNGKIISFVVRENRRYNPKAYAFDVFSSRDGKSHLNLITCEGVWNKAAQSYSKRLVVFTDKE